MEQKLGSRGDAEVGVVEKSRSRCCTRFVLHCGRNVLLMNAFSCAVRGLVLIPAAAVFENCGWIS